MPFMPLSYPRRTWLTVADAVSRRNQRLSSRIHTHLMMGTTTIALQDEDRAQVFAVLGAWVEPDDGIVTAESADRWLRARQTTPP